MTSSPTSLLSFYPSPVAMPLTSPSTSVAYEQNIPSSSTRQPYRLYRDACHHKSPKPLGSSLKDSELKNVPPLPYWQVNVPPHLRESACPDFLLNCDAKDEAILSTPDAVYRRISWPRAKEIALANRMDLFARVPSELRAYKRFMLEVKQKHGSIMNFILGERLKWEVGAEGGLTAKGEPFEEPEDIKVLPNDWPYGLDRRINHLVIWTKFSLSVDPKTNHLADATKETIERYVVKTFCGDGGVKRENVVWFWNPVRFKTVLAVEHFHVLVYGARGEFIESITGGETEKRVVGVRGL